MSRRLVSLLAVLILAVLLVPAVSAQATGSASSASSAGSASSAAGSAAAGSAEATVSLVSMTPRTPDAQHPEQPVRILATITNTTNTTFSDVRFGLQRATTISQQSLLDKAIAKPVTGADTDYAVPNPLDLHKQLLPHASVTVNYLTSVQDLCLCFHGIYPYSLVAWAVSDPAVGYTEIGRTQLLLPSFPQLPKPVEVAWVWPLLDRPHRSIDSDVFTDESLAGEISPGGRLDRALQVAELVAGQVRLTLVVDPDLLDSLAVMTAKDGYRVRKGTGTVPGTGGTLAANWLARFKAVTARHDVVLTGYGDPDVNALARAGQPYSRALDRQVQNRISPYLTGTRSTELLNWPAGEAVSTKALETLVGTGTSTLLLSDAALPGGNRTEPRPDALSPLPTAAGNATALVLDSSLEATVKRAIRVGSGTPDDGQTLLAQLAIRAEQAPDRSHFVVLAPDRYVDADPHKAASVMVAVRGTGWSAPISIPDALSTVTPVDRGALDTAAENPSAEVSPDQLTQLSSISAAVASMNEALHDNDAAAQLLAGFNLGVQRAESSAWRTDRAGGARVTQQLQSRIDGITGAVHLVRPAVGTYSLSSSNSPIVVTVSNQLSKPVTVRVLVMPADSGIGFSAQPLNQTIAAGSIETIRIPTHTERLGKFQVDAVLQTPDGRQLGATVPLSLRATAIGTVTKIITVVAIGVLVLALLRRLVQRLRHGPSRKAVPGGRVSGSGSVANAGGSA